MGRLQVGEFLGALILSFGGISLATSGLCSLYSSVDLDRASVVYVFQGGFKAW